MTRLTAIKNALDYWKWGNKLQLKQPTFEKPVMLCSTTTNKTPRWPVQIYDKINNTWMWTTTEDGFWDLDTAEGNGQIEKVRDNDIPYTQKMFISTNFRHFR